MKAGALDPTGLGIYTEAGLLVGFRPSLDLEFQPQQVQ